MANGWNKMTTLPTMKKVSGLSETVDILTPEGVISGYYDYADGIWRKIDNIPIYELKYLWSYQQ